MVAVAVAIAGTGVEIQMRGVREGCPRDGAAEGMGAAVTTHGVKVRVREEGAMTARVTEGGGTIGAGAETGRWCCTTGGDGI